MRGETNFRSLPITLPPVPATALAIDPGFEPHHKARYARIVLVNKLPALIDSEKALIMDISRSGVLAAHAQPLKVGASVVLQFDWKGDPALVSCQVCRTEEGPPRSDGKVIHQSGLAFRSYFGFSEKTIRTMIEDLVTRALDEQKANLNGIPPLQPTFVQTATARRGYVRFRLRDGQWEIEATNDPAQPLDGFTVSLDEKESDLELLRTTFARADARVRSTLQQMASLSLSTENGIPARRFEPG